MKTLFIARHGKSSWINSDIKDIDRSLDIRGIDEAYSVSKSIAMSGVELDLILSSPATRAIHTALIHCRTLEFPENQLRIHDSLYYKNELNTMDLVSKQKSEIASLMVCGHNPTSTNLVNHFLPIPINNLQTSGVVQLNFDIENWSEIITTKPINATYFKKKEKVNLI